jgi:hypothetical protein
MTTTDTRPLWAQEFPEFPPADIPPMPAGFIDDSWGDDACPSFRRDERESCVRIWIAEADEYARDAESQTRFSIAREWDDGRIPDALLDTDDWSEVLAYIAAMGTKT